MKKRILALALAGTTAFSVFGAAMSAGAADSTHTAVYNDAYVSYESVAKTIKARAEKVERSAPDVIVIESKESNSLGQMLSNTTVEGYALGADGAMIEK